MEEEDLPALETGLTHRYNDSKDYIQKHDGGRITAIRNHTDNTMDNKMPITRKQKWEGKQLYGRFKWLLNTVSHDKNLDVAKKRKL